MDLCLLLLLLLLLYGPILPMDVSEQHKMLNYAMLKNTCKQKKN